MLRNGVDVGAKDWNHGNVFHCVVAFAFLYPDKEPVMCSVCDYLNSELDRKTMMTLLMAENSGGVRPLEMAAQLGVFGIFRSIFETGDIYLVKVETYGLFNYKMYDITECESITIDNRFYKSPLNFITHMDRENLEDPNARALFEWKAITN